MKDAPVILVERLTKRYGQLTAVDDVSFAVDRGEIFGFLGPNGAGKTTTIQILATLLPPTSGTARVGGSDVVREPFAVRRKIGIVFQDPSLDSELTAEENLRLHARLYGLGAAEYRERSDELLRMVGLADRRLSKVRTYSGGMRRRLEIARGLLHHPEVLFLDEPTVGLDPQTRAAIWQHVRELRDRIGITIFMTTHYMDEAENCDRVAIMDHGKIVALDSPANLKRGLGGDVVRLTSPRGDTIASRLAAEFGLEAVKLDGQLALRVPDAATFVPRLLAEFGREVESLEIRQPSLDEVFLALTGREIRDEELSARDAAQAAMRAHARMGARRRGG